jgi:hypothetical protein
MAVALAGSTAVESSAVIGRMADIGQDQEPLLRYAPGAQRWEVVGLPFGTQGAQTHRAFLHALAPDGTGGVWLAAQRPYGVLTTAENE